MRSRFAACLIALLLPSSLFAQTLADRVPADAAVYIGWKGTDDLGAAYSDSHLKALVDASEISTFAHDAFPALVSVPEARGPLSS